jgi:hypothetical protein
MPKDAVLYGFTPHSHKRGVAANVSIRYPDGKEQMLLAIPHYDFNWQYDYFLDKPLAVPAGSRIITHWVYDNSTRNPGNPDPKRTVGWGEQSFDEMLAVYIHYNWAGETTKAPKNEYEALIQANLTLGVMDDNMDGKLQPSELKGPMGEMMKKNLAMVDSDKDGVISQAELTAAQKMLGRGRGGAPAATPVALGATSPPGGR